MVERDESTSLRDRVLQASQGSAALSIVGGNSHAFLCPGRAGEALDVSCHSGIIDYQPSELMVRVRAGTRLADLNRALAEQGQMLGFEPAENEGNATVGGAVATGIGGPRRGFLGGVADFLLGATVINGGGEILSFGGQVMKNVAGFDVSRYLVGSMGCSAVILDVSLKVLPAPRVERSFRVEASPGQASRLYRRLLGSSLSASCLQGGQLHLRFSASNDAAILRHIASLDAEEVEHPTELWSGLSNRSSRFFNERENLYQLLLPADCSVESEASSLSEWQGKKIWLADAPESIESLREQALAIGGHMSIFKASDPGHLSVFQPAPGIAGLQQRLRLAFDPGCIFNRGQQTMPWLEPAELKQSNRLD